jgi:hypothetical protein
MLEGERATPFGETGASGAMGRGKCFPDIVVKNIRLVNSCALSKISAVAGDSLWAISLIVKQQQKIKINI